MICPYMGCCELSNGPSGPTKAGYFFFFFLLLFLFGGWGLLGVVINITVFFCEEGGKILCDRIDT